MTAALKVPPVLLLPGLLLPCSFLFQIPDCQLCDLPSDQALNAVSGLDLSFPQRTGLALPSMPTVKTVYSSSSPRPRSWQGQQTPDLQPCPCGLSGAKCWAPDFLRPSLARRVPCQECLATGVSGVLWIKIRKIVWGPCGGKYCRKYRNCYNMEMTMRIWWETKLASRADRRNLTGKAISGGHGKAISGGQRPVGPPTDTDPSQPQSTQDVLRSHLTIINML